MATSLYYDIGELIKQDGSRVYMLCKVAQVFATQQESLVYFDHILGHLSWISVTKKCYQIGFLESSLRSFFSFIS